MSSGPVHLTLLVGALFSLLIVVPFVLIFTQRRPRDDTKSDDEQ